MSSKLILEVQHFHGCPNGPKMIANVLEAVKDFGDTVEYKETIVDSNELAQSIGFLGSPTLLINGVDFEGRQAPEKISLNCRVYINGLPTAEEIKAKISELLEK